MKKLHRSQTDKMITGICGGLGELFGVDATAIRLGLVFVAAVLVLLYRSAVGVLPVVLAYGVGWIIIPVAPAAAEGREAGAMKRLVRSRTDKMIAGICGGLGEMLSVDPTLIRLAVVFIGLVTAIFPILLAYLVGWAIIPIAPPQEEEHKRSVPPGGGGGFEGDRR
jgi:phage shock protein C